jgi:hypothetical protein
MRTIGWHVSDEELRRYADRALTPPSLWSTETHLAVCAACREKLAAAVDPALVQSGWARLDAEVDAPVPRPVERLATRFGVSEHTARLVATTPVLRLSWLVAVASTLALTVVLAYLTHPVVFVAVAPLLPLLGVAASFGPRVDPTYEITLVAPIHTLRVLLLRCAAVLTATTTLTAVAGLGVPKFGLVVLSWFVPALALTLLSLALTPRLGPVLAAGSVGLGWLVLLTATLGLGTSGAFVFTPLGQLTVALIAVLAAVALARLGPAFETSCRFSRAPVLGARRIQ